MRAARDMFRMWLLIWSLEWLTDLLIERPARDYRRALR